MPAKPAIENKVADFDSDLDAALSFALNNTGEVDCEISFDESGISATLPAGTSLNFDFIGDRYMGKVYGKFADVQLGQQPASDAPKKRVTIIKTLFFCN